MSCGGESFSPLLFNEIVELGIQRIINSYGPSETGMISTMALLCDKKTNFKSLDVDIGLPAYGMDLRIIKSINNKYYLCDQNEEGQLWTCNRVK